MYYALRTIYDVLYSVYYVLYGCLPFKGGGQSDLKPEAEKKKKNIPAFDVCLNKILGSNPDPQKCLRIASSQRQIPRVP